MQEIKSNRSFGNRVVQEIRPVDADYTLALQVNLVFNVVKDPGVGASSVPLGKPSRNGVFPLLSRVSLGDVLHQSGKPSQRLVHAHHRIDGFFELGFVHNGNGCAVSSQKEPHKLV